MFHASVTRKLASRTSLILFGTLIGLGLAELILRIADFPPRPLTPDAQQTFRDGRAGSPGWPIFRTERDFRVTPKQEEVRRVVFLGDSFTWGDGVEPEETYPKVFESLLRKERSPSPLEVINWSRPGWNTWRELKSIEPQLPTLDPDLLIIGYCINDAEPINRRQLNELRRAMRTAQREPSSRPIIWLYEQTRLGQLVFDFFENRRLRKAVTGYYQTLYDDGRSGWVRVRDSFEIFNKISRQQSLPILVVIFPVFDSQLDHRYGYRNLHELVAEAVTRSGLEVLDLLPHFEDYDGRDLAVVPFSDAHPSALAHRIAAERILGRLEQLGGVFEPW